MGYTNQQALDFISTIAPLHVAEARKRGYKIVSTAIAQSIIEGACGTSTLAKSPNNNHWGLKAGSSWVQAGKPYVRLRTKEEYQKGVLTTIYDNFRKFPNGNAEAVAGYYDFISMARYSGGAPNYEKGNLKTATTPREYAERLKLDGYATSSSYINTLCSTVSKYSLEIWDRVLNVEIMSAPQSSEFKNLVAVDTYLNVRTAPVSGTIVGKLNNKDEVIIKDYQGGWYRLNDNKWVSATYISSRRATINVEHKLNVRAGNSTKYDALGQVTRNTVVKVLNESNGWYQIVTPDDLFGWVKGQYINLI